MQLRVNNLVKQNHINYWFIQTLRHAPWLAFKYFCFIKNTIDLMFVIKINYWWPISFLYIRILGINCYCHHACWRFNRAYASLLIYDTCKARELLCHMSPFPHRSITTGSCSVMRSCSVIAHLVWLELGV